MSRERPHVTCDLRKLPRKLFSFSEYLSPVPIGKGLCLTITLDGKPLDATYLIQLALNEECRRLKRGCFYKLPLRQESSKGHPCDLVFIDEPWGEKSRQALDHSDWNERLKMCDAGMSPLYITLNLVPLHLLTIHPSLYSEKKITPHEQVMPVCARIMKFTLPEVAQGTVSKILHNNSC